MMIPAVVNSESAPQRNSTARITCSRARNHEKRRASELALLIDCGDVMGATDTQNSV
jgi:hypothetical protein